MFFQKPVSWNGPDREWIKYFYIRYLKGNPNLIILRLMISMSSQLYLPQ